MIQGFDPRTSEPVGEPVAEATDVDVDVIVAVAAAAFPAWSAYPRRAEALEAVADALDARAAELAVIADTETALGGERLQGEVARATGQLRLFAAVLRDGGYLDTVVTPAAGAAPELRRINRPVGPVAVFAASNFPFAFSVVGGDTASALAAGCPVVVKAHEGHPVTSQVCAQIVTEALAAAGAPAGAFALVHGVQAGLRLLRHPAGAGARVTRVRGAASSGGAGASRGGGMLSARIFAGYQDAVAEAEAHPGVTALAEGQPGPGPWGATPRVFQTSLKEFAADIAVLSRERFGPAGLVITYSAVEDLLPALAALPGNLVGTVQLDTGSAQDLDLGRQLVPVLERIAGRIVCNGWPTGVAVVAAQHHGGPWPATTAPAYTSVGTAAIRRWLVPVAYQDFPSELLPPRLAGL